MPLLTLLTRDEKDDLALAISLRIAHITNIITKARSQPAGNVRDARITLQTAEIARLRNIERKLQL
jgi:hypothetical protein